MTPNGDMEFDITLPSVPGTSVSRIAIEGVDISHWVRGITIDSHVGGATTVTLDLIKVQVSAQVQADEDGVIYSGTGPDEFGTLFDEDGNGYIG